MKIKYTLIFLLLIIFGSVPVATFADNHDSIFGKEPSLQECMFGIACTDPKNQDCEGEWQKKRVQLSNGVREERIMSPGSCSIYEIFTLTNSVIRWGAGISGALALLMYIIGGMWMIFSGGNSSRVQRGKDVIIGTTISLIFILGSWLIIDFSVRALKGGQQGINPTICTTPDSTAKPCGDNSYCFNNTCQSACAIRNASYTDQEWQCQSPASCLAGLEYADCETGSYEFCQIGICPGDITQEVVCCYTP